MLFFLQDSFLDLMRRGGVVMWPLLALSLVAVTLIVERAWFWIKTNHAVRLVYVQKMARLLRQGERQAVLQLIDKDTSVYASVVRTLLSERYSEALATDAIEAQRHRIERFMPSLSTIITAAPMLGILGTVTGIIASFRLLSDDALTIDPKLVGAGIAEALLTTAAGLVVAIVVLFPYNAFRAQIDRTMGRCEMLASAASRQQHSEQH